MAKFRIFEKSVFSDEWHFWRQNPLEPNYDVIMDYPSLAYITLHYRMLQANSAMAEVIDVVKLSQNYEICNIKYTKHNNKPNNNTQMTALYQLSHDLHLQANRDSALLTFYACFPQHLG